MRARYWLGLILCNLLWAFHPMMGKLALESFTPVQCAWLRYASGLATLLILSPIPQVSRTFLHGQPALISFRKTPRSWELFLLGFMPFCFSPLLQFLGLSKTQAMDNSVIIAMEPVVTVFLAWMIIGERPRSRDLVALGLGLVGFVLLSGLGFSFGSQVIGCLLILVSFTGEATYSIIGRRWVDRYPPFSILMTALVAGVASLTVFALFSGDLLTLPHPSWRSAGGILWLGPLGTALTYLFWMVTLKYAPISALVVTIFVQPLAGALVGAVFLGESLNARQSLGGLLILVALAIQSWRASKKSA